MSLKGLLLRLAIPVFIWDGANAVQALVSSQARHQREEVKISEMEVQQHVMGTHGHGDEAEERLRNHPPAGSHGHGNEHPPTRSHGHENESAHAETGQHYYEHTGDSEQHGVHAHGGEGAKAVAIGLLSSVVLLPSIVYMALSDNKIAEYTIKMLDTFISIFLAVLWFNCFSQFMTTFHVQDMFPYARECLSLMQVFVMYSIAQVIAYINRDKKLALFTFCTTGAHYIAFTGISASYDAQHAASRMAPHEYAPYASLGFCVVVIVCILGVSVLNYFLWLRRVKHNELIEAIGELEIDVVGLVASFVITQAVRHLLTGQYPLLHLLQLDRQTSVHVHAKWQIWFMLGWSITLTMIAGFLLPRITKLGKGFLVGKAIHMFKVIVIMLVAWGYLLWAEWQFEEWFHGEQLFGSMVFAMLATMASLGVLWLLALGEDKVHSIEERDAINMTIDAVSLMAAWSWERCFNSAFDVIGDEYQVGYGGLVPKLFLATMIPIFLLPTYVIHIKRRVIEYEESESLGRRHAEGASVGHDAHGQ